jgi:glycerophosphoryl diester phosphodiesterase
MRYSSKSLSFLGTCFAVSFSVAASIIFSEPTSALTLSRCQNIEVISHRGSWDARHTENTLRSFNRAVNSGVKVIETDLRKTADDEWVLMHDITVDRTTNGSGAVGKQTLAKIQSYKTDDGVKGGVPSLGQGLLFLKNNPRAQMHIEFKTTNVSDSKVKTVLDRARAQGVLNRIVFTSFDQTILLQIQQLDPSVNVGLLTSQQVTARTAAKFDNAIYIDKTKASKTYIDRMHASGVKVGTWKVDTKDEWRSNVLSGADYVTTDNASLLKQLCRSV